MTAVDSSDAAWDEEIRRVRRKIRVVVGAVVGTVLVTAVGWYVYRCWPSRRWHDVPYDTAVRRLKELYPVMEHRLAARATPNAWEATLTVRRRHPAYDYHPVDEHPDSHWELGVVYREALPGRRFEIEVTASVKLDARTATFIIEKVGSGTRVTVEGWERSELVPFGWREKGYERARLREIAAALRPEG